MDERMCDAIIRPSSEAMNVDDTGVTVVRFRGPGRDEARRGKTAFCSRWGTAYVAWLLRRLTSAAGW